MVLLILAVGGVALSAACRRSVRRSLDATRAADDLQRRWGTLSCRQALLTADVDDLLVATRTTDGKPATAISLSFPLGSMDLQVVIGDEQAKVNLNMLNARAGRHPAEAAARSILRTAGFKAIPTVTLPAAPNSDRQRKASAPPSLLARPGGGEPADDDDDESPMAPVVASLDEVFATAGPSDLFPSAGAGSPATLLTCWGDGKLNFRRAPRAALAGMCSPILSPAQIERLERLRSLEPDIGLEAALGAVGASRSEQVRLAARLKDASWCHSLWVAARTRERTYFHLYVRDEIDEDHVSTFAFEW